MTRRILPTTIVLSNRKPSFSAHLSDASPGIQGRTAAGSLIFLTFFTICFAVPPPTREDRLMYRWIALGLWMLIGMGCSTVLGLDDVSFDGSTDGPFEDVGVPDASADADSSGGSSGTGTGGTGNGGTGNGGTGTGGTVADAGSGEPTQSPCEAVDCSGQGTCEESDAGQAQCACHAGYHPDGLACIADETCADVECGRCGQCEVFNGVATCTCPAGFTYNGSECIPDPDPCDTTNCGAEEVCVSEAHCQRLGACFPKCDCSNCGNCGSDNSDGRWDDWGEYCGAEPNQSPATVTCTKPCPSGSGCLPFAQPLCWPGEGCFSM